MNHLPLTADPSAVEHRGCRLNYCVRGDGPPVLLIQGVGIHGAGWRPQVDALAVRYRCLTFDNRGMGRSQPIGAALSVEQMADDARALMDSQGWDSAHVIGHSLGGLVAQHLALSARDRVRSLALLCTFADGRAVAPLTWGMAWLGLRMKFGTRRMRRRAFLELLMPPAALAETDRDELAERLAPLFGHDLAEHAPVTRMQLAAMRACDATPRLGELTGLPTLVVSAAHDQIAPPALGRALADAIPGARYVELSGAAHGIPIHDAERVNALLLGHLAWADALTPR